MATSRTAKVNVNAPKTIYKEEEITDEQIQKEKDRNWNDFYVQLQKRNTTLLFGFGGIMWLSSLIGHNAMSHNNKYCIRHYDVIIAFGKIGLELSVVLLLLTMINSWQPEKSWAISRYFTYVLYTVVRLLVAAFIVMGVCITDIRAFVEQIIAFPKDSFNPELNEKPNIAGITQDWVETYCWFNAIVTFSILGFSYFMMVGAPIYILMQLLT